MAASLAEQLAARKTLKAVASSETREIRPQLCETEQDYLRMIRDANFEQYWSLIEHLSFPSRLLPLSQQAARELRQAHDARLAGDDDLAAYPALAAACAAMDDVYTTAGWSGLFLRLSTRSPKDAALSTPGMAATLAAEYERLRAAESSDPLATPASTLLHALYRVSTFVLRRTSVRAAVQLLIDSQRIQGDLDEYVASPPSSLAFNFVLREFADFEPENEFRAFVHRRQLTAVTQYNEFCYFPALPARVDGVFADLLPRLLRDDVIPLLPDALSNAVVDIVMLRRSDGWQMKVVELNPFAEFASSGLFTWEADWKTLQGRAPFEFRCARCPPPGADRLDLPSSWKAVLDSSGLLERVKTKIEEK